MHLPEQRRYGLGVAAFELGSRLRAPGAAALDRPDRAHPARRRRPPTTRHLAVLHGRDVLYVIEERAAGRPGLVTDVGVRLPAHLTASGLAMLAALPPAAARRAVPQPRARSSAATTPARRR